MFKGAYINCVFLRKYIKKYRGCSKVEYKYFFTLGILLSTNNNLGPDKGPDSVTATPKPLEKVIIPEPRAYFKIIDLPYNYSLEDRADYKELARIIKATIAYLRSYTNVIKNKDDTTLEAIPAKDVFELIIN